jgi:hypothetical protein
MRAARLFLAAAALFFAAPAPATALDLGDIRGQIRVNVRDAASPAGTYRYSDTVLDAFINEAQRELVNQTWCLQASTSIALTAATTYYDLPEDLLAVQQVRIRDSASKVTELAETSRRKLFQDNPDFERATATAVPTDYFIQFPTTGDQLQMGVYPAPRSTAGTLLIDYASQAEELSDSSDIPLNGYRHLYPYHEALIYRVSARIKLIEGFASEATAHMELYALELQSMNRRVGDMPNYNPGFKGGKP